MDTSSRYALLWSAPAHLEVDSFFRTNILRNWALLDFCKTRSVSSDLDTAVALWEDGIKKIIHDRLTPQAVTTACRKLLEQINDTEECREYFNGTRAAEPSNSNQDDGQNKRVRIDDQESDNSWQDFAEMLVFDGVQYKQFNAYRFEYNRSLTSEHKANLKKVVQGVRLIEDDQYSKAARWTNNFDCCTSVEAVFMIDMEMSPKMRNWLWENNELERPLGNLEGWVTSLISTPLLACFRDIEGARLVFTEAKPHPKGSAKQET
ncbi:hypothetical protein BX616_004916, partial [Lobosporangium transversale]